VRHGELAVRQFEDPSDYDVTLIVDLWQPSKPAARDAESVELIVSFAATVVVDLCRRRSGALLLAIAAEQPACVAGATSTLLMREALEELAVARAAPEDGLPAALEAARRESHCSNEILLLSTRPPDRLDASQLTALPLKKTPPASGRVRMISACDSELDSLFQLE
jgi:uncharacterized protein (DUF58 family)